VLVMDPDGEERWRLEGYLSKDEFRAHLEMGLARLALIRKNWPEAEKRYAEVMERYPSSRYAPEAIYYRGVSRYSASHESAELAAVAQTFTEKHQDSIWAMKSLPWLP